MLLVSSSSQTIPIKFLLFPSITHQNPLFSLSSHQNPFVPTTSHQLPFVPNPILYKPTQSSKFCETLGQSAKRSAPVPGQARKGTYSDRQTSVWCGRAESGDFVPVRFCERSRADLLLARQSAALLPSCACAIMRNERV